MREARRTRVMVAGLALLSALGLAARADTLLLSDNFNSASESASGFNNTLASDQSGPLATVSYYPAGHSEDWNTQHGNGGRMLLYGIGRSPYVSLNRNFAVEANLANAPLKIQFQIQVIDASDPSNWATIALGSSQNAFVNDGANKFSSLFRRNGGTQQFGSGNFLGDSPTFNPAGATVVVLISDTAGTGSPFNGNGSVVKLYIDGSLASTYTLSQMSAADGYISMQAAGSFALYDDLTISLVKAVEFRTTTTDVRTVPSAGNLSGDTALSLYNDGGGNVQRTWINFDLSSSTGKTVTSSGALALRSGIYGSYLTGVSLNTVNSSWSLAGITHENQPGFTSVPGVTNPDGSYSLGDVISWTIPATALQSWIDSGYNGIALSSGAGSTLHFYSSRAGAAPELAYGAIVNANGTWVSTGNGNWTDTTKWQSDTVAMGVDKTATFSGGTAATVTLDTARTVIGALSFVNADYSLAGNPLTLDVTSGSPTVTVASARTATLGVTLQGSDGLRKEGAGTLTLTAINAYSGGTTVEDGTLQLNASGGWGRIQGALTVNASGTVETTGDGTGLGWNDQISSVTINDGLLTSAGIIHIWNISGGVNMNGGTLRSNGGVNDPNGNQLEWNRTDLNVAASTNTAVVAGRIRIRADGGYSAITFNVGDGSVVTDLLVSAAITEASGGLGLTKSGAGTLVLSGTNTFTGTTVINGGHVRLANNGGAALQGSVTLVNPVSFLLMDRANQFGPNAGVYFNSSGSHNEMALYGHDQTIASLASANPYAVVQNSHGGWGAAATSSVLTVNQSSDTTYSGVIRDNTGNDSYKLSLVKAGAGRLTFSSPVGYSGNTTVSGGALQMDSASLADGSTISIASGANLTLNFAGSDTVAGLVLNGVAQPLGTYNATTHPAYFSGAGSLVVAIPTRTWDNGAGTYNWNTTDVNWSGSLWGAGENAVFASDVGTITLTAPQTAASLTFGNSSANYTGAFAGSALAISGNLTARGWGGNDFGGPVVSFGNSVGVGGAVLLGRRNLTITGGTFGADRVGSLDSWAEFKVAGGSVTMTNGIDDGPDGGNTLRVTLTGGSLSTPYIRTTQASWRPSGSNSDGVELNGGTLIALADSGDFIQTRDGYGWGVRDQIMVGTGGANINTAGRAITITKGLIDYGGAGTLTKSGTGTLKLSGYNSYSGSTTVNGGVLELSGAGGGWGNIRGAITVNAAGTLNITDGDGTGFGWNTPITSLTINGGTVNAVSGSHMGFGSYVTVALNNGGVIAGSWQWNGDGMLGFSSSGNSQNRISGGLSLRGDGGAYHTFSVANGAAAVDLLVDATLADQWPEVWWVSACGLIKSGAGTLSLAGTNTYGGVTVLSGGVLEAGTLANYGTASSLGDRASGDDAGGDVGLLFRGGTLRYAGATAQSTDRGIRLSTTGGGGTIDASGSSPSATLSFTASSSPNFFENPGDRTLTLTGSNTGANQFGMAIGQAGGTTSLNKSGPGRWVLTGVSTYSGTTTIGAGTLALSGSGSIGSSLTLSLATGATLDVSAVTGGFTLQGVQTLTGEGTVAGNVTAATGALIVPGGGSYGTLTFSGDLALQGQPFTFDLSSTPAGSNDRIVVSGALTGTGSSVITLNYVDGQLGPGTYTLMTYASHPSGTFSLNRPYSNVTLVDTGTALTLVVSATSYLGNTSLIWAGDGSVNAWNVASALNWTLSGADRFMFDNGDTVSFTAAGSNSPAISVSGTVQPASISVSGNKTYTLAGSGQVGGSGALTINAAGGGLVFENAAGYSGNTTLSAGTLTLKNDYASPAFSIASGAVLEFNVDSGERNYTPDTTFSGNGTLRKTGAGGARWGSPAATFNLGAGSLIDVQAGYLVGGSHANENWSSCLANLTVAAGASFSGVEANVRVNALSGAGAISSGYPGAGYVAFTFGVNNGSGTFSGALQDGTTAGSFVKEGSGTQTLTGESSYTGSTTINGGILSVTGGGKLYSTLGWSTRPVVINSGATLEVDRWAGEGSLGQNSFSKDGIQIYGGRIRYTGTSNAHDADNNGPGFTVGSGGATLESASSGQTWYINYDSRGDYYIERSSGTLTLTGIGNGQIDKVIPGSGSLVKSGSGTWTLAATNTLTGGITINQGALAFANAAAVTLSPAITLAAAGTCDVSSASGFSLLAGQTLSGFGAVKGDLATVNGAAIVPGTAGTAGTLRFLHALTLQDQTNHFDLSGNPASGNDRIDVGGTVTLNNDTFVHLSYLDGLLGEGVYTVMTYAAKSGAGAFYLDGPAYNNVTLDDSSPTQLLVVVGAGGSQLGAANLVWLGDGLTNVWETAGALNWKVSGPQRFAFNENDRVTFNGTGSLSPAIEVIGIVRPSSVALTGAQTYHLGGSGRLAGTNTLTVNGTGGLVLNLDADYTGPTTVSAGTLTLSNTLHFASPVSIAAAGTLQVGGGSNWAFNSSALVNGGLLRKIGTGTVSFSTGGSFGSVAVAGGMLRPTSNGVAVTLSALTVAAQATNDLYGANLTVNTLTGTGAVVNTGGGAALVTVGGTGGSSTFNGTLGGGGGGSIALVKSGAGTFTLAGTNSYTGGTTLNGGTLALASSVALGNSGAIGFGGGTLQFSAANAVDYSARFSTGAGQPFRLDTAGQNVTLASGLAGVGSTLTKLGLGTLTLGGANGYNGVTVVGAGTLKLGAGGSLASTSVTLAAGTVFDVASVSGFSSSASVGGKGTIQGDVAAASGFTLLPGSAATAGTLTVVGTLTLGGSATCRFELAAAKDVGGGINDLLAVQGDLAAGGAHLVVTNLSSGAPITAGDYVLFTYTGTLTGTFDPVVTCPYPASLDYSVPGEVRLVVSCEAGGAAPIVAAAPRATFTVNSLSGFTISATDPGCVAPALSASPLPSGVNFTTSTSGDGSTRFGTFTWTPASGQQGTYPVRVVANDGTLSTATNLLLHVRSVGEGTNAVGVPVSQTNWHVSITNLIVPEVGSATLVWSSTNGIGYDVYVSTNSYGSQTMTWTKEVANVMASGTQQTAAVAAGAQKYVQVVPAGFAPSSANLWAVIEPVIAPGFNLFAAPLTGSDLKMNGEFGTNLAVALDGHGGGTGDHLGDEVFLLNADGSYSNLYLDASGVWRTSGGAVATHQLVPGQGLIVLRNSVESAQPHFSGPVGNTLARTNTIQTGNANLIAFSEGKYLTPAAAFANPSSGTPVGGYDENEADQIVFVEPDGSFRPVLRLPDGTWLDLTTFESAGYLFTPGRAAFYIRQPSGGTLEVKF